jgi:hypothetical protein
MYDRSAAYAADLNGRVTVIQSTINESVFGWVNGRTKTLDETLNAYYTDVQSAADIVFAGTILEQLVQEFIRCFIGYKVDALENALTFLHNHLVVDRQVCMGAILVAQFSCTSLSVHKCILVLPSFDNTTFHRNFVCLPLATMPTRPVYSYA